MTEFIMNASNINFLIEKIKNLDTEKMWSVKIVEFKTKRTNAQNSRYWAFLTAYGEFLGYTKDEMHDLCRLKFLSEDVEVNGEMFKKVKSTPKTDTKEFSEYCEHCERWAMDYGFYFGE